ncbi:MAG: phage holin family protein [Gammaproteobacteria bacterium]|nr:phage holin family protein [Gammaproteobacteria bacterium]
MLGIVIRLLIIAVGLWLADVLIPGLMVDGPAALLWAALWLGIVNAVVRPVVVILTLPITLLSLGGFLLVVNAGMLALVAWLLDGFAVTGFFPALFGSLVVSIISWLAASFIGPNGRYEILVIERRG